MTQRMRRRDLLRAVGGTVAASVGTAGTAGVVAGQSSVDAWLSNVSNYDGVVDETGSSEVTVTVGAAANGGSFGFGPAAVRVDPGTTVTWKWNGEGGSHNVVGADGGFESELVGESGHTFSHTFEEAGIYRYACSPHKAVGMKGAVVVGDVNVGSDSSGGSESSASDTADSSGGNDGDGENQATASASSGDAGSTGGSSSAAETGPGDGFGDDDAFLVLGGSVLVAALSPVGFGLVLKAAGDGSEGAQGWRNQ